MSKQFFLAALVLACVVGVTGALASGPRVASADITGDVCSITAWDSNGNVLPDGATVGGNGYVYLVFRVQDDPFGYVNDFVLDGPVQDIIDQLEDEIADLEDQIADEEAEADPDEDLIAELEAEIAALEEVLLEYEEAIEGILDTDLVQIDSSTGSARILSKAEVVGFEWVKPNVAHVLVTPGVLSQRVDHIFPNFFNNSDGHDLDNISDWLEDVGVPSPGSFGNNVCGGSTVDGWGFVDIKCIEPGRFRVNVIPQRETSENTRGTIDLYCPGQADRAEIATQRTTVETQPTNVAPGGFGTSVITVTVWDQADNRLDGAKVTFSTNNCQFRNTDPVGDNPVSPAGGGTTVVTYSDSDTVADDNFLADNPLQEMAGTAEALLNCTLPGSTPGVAKVTAVVEREGADIVLNVDVNVVGPTAVSGLTLVLTPDDIECGETIKATAKAVDAVGNPVSAGTTIYFTTDTSSGVVGGTEGAQGAMTTINGEASVLIATDPSNPGIHTVIAFVVNAAGTPSAQTSANYECSGAVAPAAPTVAPPATGTGTITPPSTGDAGLADAGASKGKALWFAAVAVVTALFSGLGLAAVRNR